jgi:3-phosphoshikimate 1-carboxyvinyltransferase
VSERDAVPRAIEMRPLERPPQATIRVPGSKSITNRALLLAALAEGESVVEGALFSDDSTYMAAALRQLGAGVEEDRGAARFRVRGTGGVWGTGEAALFIGNAGTAARFLVAALCLGRGTYVLDGNERMRQRPIGDLITALRSLGVDLESPTDCPPVTIRAAGLPGGVVEVSSGRSSQFLSAMLMVAPYATADLEIRASDDLIARPYVDMTLAMMAQFGVDVARDGYRSFRAAHGQRYRARRYPVEADASSAHYFLAAAALTGGEVRIEGVGRESLQGDIGFADALGQMGAAVSWQSDAVSLRGGARLRGGDFDMNAISDTSMTLAVLAPFAEAPVRIRNVAHIRGQESDRLAAVTAELTKLGARVVQRDDGWEISPSAPGELHGAEIETYDDHRIAMAFALAGLRIPGVVIRDPGCVAKTYPDFFADLERLR